jgi:hypothetical protein
LWGIDDVPRVPSCVPVASELEASSGADTSEPATMNVATTTYFFNTQVSDLDAIPSLSFVHERGRVRHYLFYTA